MLLKATILHCKSHPVTSYGTHNESTVLLYAIVLKL